MTLNAFIELCASISTAAGIEIPDVAQDEEGLASITIEKDGVSVAVAHRSDLPGRVIVALGLGAVAEEDDYKACRILMESNFLMMGERATPCIGRNPSTREFVLHYTHQLEGTRGVEIYGSALAMIEVAKDWQRQLSGSAQAPSFGAMMLDRA